MHVRFVKDRKVIRTNFEQPGIVSRLVDAERRENTESNKKIEGSKTKQG